MKAVNGWLIVFALVALSACDAKKEAPVEPQAQAEPAALKKAPEAEAQTPPKSHVRLENVKTLVPLEKLDAKELKKPRRIPLNEDEEGEESNESKAE